MCIRDRQYSEYYKRCATANDPKMRDPNPIVILVPSVGMFTFASDKTTARLAAEFYPVSYTHLDVYKRQDVTLSAKLKLFGADAEIYATANNLFQKRPPFVANRFAANLGFPTIPTCLLYTSRCV